MQPITLTEAAKRAGVSSPTVIYWMKKHDIAEYFEGKRMVNPSKLALIMKARSALKSRQPVGE